MGLAMLVFVVLLIPLIYVSIGFSLVTPVAALEHKWPFDALTRSWQLTKGVRGPIFGALFVIGIALMVVKIVVGVSVGVAFGLLVSPYLASALSEIITEVVGQLMTVAVLVIYLGLLPAGEQRHTVDALGAPAQD
jgi:membrane-anchored glycerophosphoryl diester phosphodiesterase (GDPDase)